MKVIYTRVSEGVKHIQVDAYFVICLDILLNQLVMKNYVSKYPVDFYVYPPFDLCTTQPNEEIVPLQYGTFYIPVTHNYTIRELVKHITKRNALFSSFPSLY